MLLILQHPFCYFCPRTGNRLRARVKQTSAPNSCPERADTTAEVEQSVMNCFSPVNKAAAKCEEVLQSSNMSALLKHLGTATPPTQPPPPEPPPPKPREALKSKPTPGIQRDLSQSSSRSAARRGC